MFFRRKKKPAKKPYDKAREDVKQKTLDRDGTIYKKYFDLRYSEIANMLMQKCDYGPVFRRDMEYVIGQKRLNEMRVKLSETKDRRERVALEILEVVQRSRMTRDNGWFAEFLCLVDELGGISARAVMEYFEDEYIAEALTDIDSPYMRPDEAELGDMLRWRTIRTLRTVAYHQRYGESAAIHYHLYDQLPAEVEVEIAQSSRHITT